MIGHARSDGRRAGGRSDIGQVIVLVRGILVRGDCKESEEKNRIYIEKAQVP